METELVSIIIPAYNRAEFIAGTLESIAAQTYRQWECIVVDDGSTDDTPTIIQKFASGDSRFRFFHRPGNLPKGANACRNFGFLQSRGAFVNWFDSDDLMYPDFIEKKVESLLSSNADGVISKRAMFRELNPAVISYESRTTLSENLLEDFLTLKVTWYLQDVMWKREFLSGKTLFDEALRAGQDREFHSRMLLFSPHLTLVDAYLTLYRMHEKNITTSLSRDKQGVYRNSVRDSVYKLIRTLRLHGKLSKTLRLHYFALLLKDMPFVYRDPEKFKKFKSELLSLSFFHPGILKGWIKFALGWLSYRLTGRGHFFVN